MISLPLPLRHETILILFHMPGNEYIWWKTTINNITPSENNGLRAAAAVTYNDGYDKKGNFYKEENGTVHFYSGDKIVVSTESDTFSSSSETKWKHIGGRHNSIDATFHRDDNANTEEQPKQDATDEYLPQSSKRRRLHRSSKRHEAVKDKDVVITSNNNNTSAHAAALNTTTTEHQHLRTCLSIMQRQLLVLQDKVAAIQSSQEQKNMNTTLTRAKKYIKYEILRNIRRAPARYNGECTTKFFSILRRAPIQFSIQCTLDEFADIANDINERRVSTTTFLPSLFSIKTRSQPFQQKHICFESFRSLLSWLDITDEAVANQLLIRNTERKTIKNIQVVGGSQWNDLCPDTPLDVFLGRSCAREAPRIQRYVECEKDDSKHVKDEIEDAKKAAATDSTTEGMGTDLTGRSFVKKAPQLIQVFDDDFDSSASTKKASNTLEVSDEPGTSKEKELDETIVPTERSPKAPPAEQPFSGNIRVSPAAAILDNISSLHLQNTTWDEENGSFRTEFEVGAANQHMELLSTSSIYDFDCFTLSWRPLPGLRPQDISELGNAVVLGKLIVHVPAVIFTGAPTCSRINFLLRRDQSDILFSTSI